MILKRKEIVAASLVLLIGIAGYLNWSYQDTIHITDGESFIETGKKLGEAQYVSGDVEGVGVDLEDGVEAGAGLIDVSNTLHVHGGQFPGGDLAGVKGGLNLLQR